MTNEITGVQGGQIVSAQQEPRSVVEMQAAMDRMREYRDGLMVNKVHFGTIPKCGKKPTLLKPGAEILMAGFNAVPSLEVTKIDEGEGHRTFEVTARLMDRHSGTPLGEGVGSCSTLETKYRYRNDKLGPIPEEYWDKRDASLLGEGCTAKKLGDKWFVCRQVEHPDPADYWNTCLKMAKKRAIVDAALTMAAASELFTQDIEDMNLPEKEETSEPSTPTQAAANAAAPTGSEPIGERQAKKIYAIAASGNGLGSGDFKGSCKAVQQLIKDTMDCTVKGMPANQFDSFIEHLRGLVGESKTATVPPPAGIRPVEDSTLSDDEVPPEFRQ